MDSQIIQGRKVGADEIALIRHLIAENPDWHRSRLSQELCSLWDWSTPTGQIKDIAARSLLQKLAARGEITLPPSKRNGAGARSGVRAQRPRQLRLFGEAEPAMITDPLSSVQPLEIVLAEQKSDVALFTALLQAHHYLGLDRSVGQNLKYLVYDSHQRLLACLLFGSPAWRCADRDCFIGWSDATRARRLGLITNNMRFLILPWVRIPHLASHVLGCIRRRIRHDWQVKYGQPLVLLETFVDQSRFAGTCYQAANWIRVGQTRGRSRNDRYKALCVPVKAVYVYPLVPNFREVLTR